VPLRAFDQPFNCEYVQLLGVGQCVYSDNVEDIKRSIEKIEANNFLQDRVKQLAKVLRKKAEEPQDLLYWMEYMFDVGTNHLQPPQY